MDIGIDLDNTIYDSTNDMLLDDVVDTLRSFIDKGYTLHIITGRYSTRRNRYEVNRVVDILLEYNISISSITYTHRLPKGIYARDIGCSYMIDDQYHYLSDCYKYGVIPIVYHPILYGWSMIDKDII